MQSKILQKYPSCLQCIHYMIHCIYIYIYIFILCVKCISTSKIHKHLILMHIFEIYIYIHRSLHIRYIYICICKYLYICTLTPPFQVERSILFTNPGVRGSVGWMVSWHWKSGVDRWGFTIKWYQSLGSYDVLYLYIYRNIYIYTYFGGVYLYILGHA